MVSAVPDCSSTYNASRAHSMFFSLGFTYGNSMLFSLSLSFSFLSTVFEYALAIIRESFFVPLYLGLCLNLRFYVYVKSYILASYVSYILNEYISVFRF